MRVVLLIGALVVVLIGVYDSTQRSRALNVAEQQRQTFEQELTEANEQFHRYQAETQQRTERALRDAIEGHTRLLTQMARQHRPGAEWTATAVNAQTLRGLYEKTFSDFVSHAPHRERFPELVAVTQYRLGQMHFLLGNHAAALDSLGDAIYLGRSTNDLATVGLARNTRGCIQATFGNLRAAQEDFEQALQSLGAIGDHEVPVALSLRNLGLTQRSMAADGIPSLEQSVESLAKLASQDAFSYTNELLIDARMVLCESYWTQSYFDLALGQCEQAYQELLLQLELTKDMGKSGAVRNRYLRAICYAERNLTQLNELSQQQLKGTASGIESLPFASGWRWRPLFDLRTELVSPDLTVTAVMEAEFDRQNGLLLAWGMYDWTKQLVVDVAKNCWSRSHLTIVADNFESLREARHSLEEAEVPTSEMTFSICAHETSWFRDGGPIVGKAADGRSIWFDAKLTRFDLERRMVTDALPRLISDDWSVRVARTPLHIEGGMLLSNGRGLTLYSRPLLEINSRYGFTKNQVLRELQRVTGAEELVMADAMIDEATGHLDMFMTFVDPQTIVLGEFLDRSEPNAKLLDKIADQLRDIEFDGKRLQVVRIPMPPRRESTFTGRRTGIFRSFTNVVYANGLLLVPSYGEETESMQATVKGIYAERLPGWDIQFVDCERISQFGGALHCLVSNLGDTPHEPMIFDE